jgi:flavoprotein
MSKDCRGSCFFQQNGNGTFIKKKGNRCECKLQICPKCKEKMPQKLLDCCKGFCPSCAVTVFSALEMVEKKLNIQEIEGKEYLQKFTDLMAEFFNYQK